jgi:hypothetical protein
MIVEEGRPGLAMWPGKSGDTHKLLNGAFGESDAELAQFALNAFGSPETILASHLSDQHDGLGRYAPSGCCWLTCVSISGETGGDASLTRLPA